MSISAVGAAGAATPTSQSKSATPSAAQPSFAEISKLAVTPQDSVTLSEQAKNLMQGQGMGAALSILGN